MHSRRRIAVAITLAALFLSACGGDDQRSGADQTTPPTEATTTTEASKGSDTTADGGTANTHDAEMKTKFTIVGKNLAFDPSKITIPIHEEVEIIFDNVDAAVPHNIHFETPKDFKTETKNGPEKDTLKIKVDKAGTYKFLCDVHPTMTGELTVR